MLIAADILFGVSQQQAGRVRHAKEIFLDNRGFLGREFGDKITDFIRPWRGRVRFRKLGEGQGLEKRKGENKYWENHERMKVLSLRIIRTTGDEDYKSCFITPINNDVCTSMLIANRCR